MQMSNQLGPSSSFEHHCETGDRRGPPNMGTPSTNVFSAVATTTTPTMMSTSNYSNTSLDDGCNASYNSTLSAVSVLLLLLLLLVAVLGLMFIFLVRKLMHTMDIWLAMQLLDLLILVLAKLVQELTETGLCLFTQNMIYFGIMSTQFHHLGMALEKANAVTGTRHKKTSRCKVATFALCSYALILLIIIIIVVCLGLDVNLNRGPNMCREGPTKETHTIVQGTKATISLIFTLLMLVVTIYTIYKLLRARFATRVRMVLLVGVTGLVCVMCWSALSVPLAFVATPGRMGFECTNLLFARYFHGVGFFLVLLLILLHIWAFRQFMDALKKQFSVTAKYIRGHTSSRE
uniref:BILF1 n=1 Tax=Symphalangus syndactylus lymphocryptovirus 1 TaxID=1567495 RepID=A0A0A0RY38_9GAMA|nr:BILF1 [Symphalangus syndactylus lymphocryptovirus 1]